jgi:uncharacterized protein
MGTALTRLRGVAAGLAILWIATAAYAQGTAALPQLTQPVNDFAHVIDAGSAAELDRMIRELQRASGDTVIVATVPSIEPYATARDYAVKLFENDGRGIGQRGKDNGLLILLAPAARRVEIEVGYDLEQWVTDGFAGEVSRGMTAAFRNGDYGPGLVQGTTAVIGRIAQGRGVQLTGVPVPERRPSRQSPNAANLVFLAIVVFILLSQIGGGRRRGHRRWGGGGWSGWSSGVGPFGGGYHGGGFGRGGWGGGGGGFGGGFGGFGGGRSGGGGGGAGW